MFVPKSLVKDTIKKNTKLDISDTKLKKSKDMTTTKQKELVVPEIVSTDVNSLNISTLTTSYVMWPSMDSCFYLDQNKTVAMIEQYVRNKMFKKLKFISDPTMIAFSWEKNSLCQTVCTKFKVARLEQTMFWSYYQNTINQKLNKKRSEVSNAMRKSFKGKY